MKDIKEGILEILNTAKFEVDNHNQAVFENDFDEVSEALRNYFNAEHSKIMRESKTDSTDLMICQQFATSLIKENSRLRDILKSQYDATFIDSERY